MYWRKSLYHKWSEKYNEKYQIELFKISIQSALKNIIIQEYASKNIKKYEK